MTPNNDIDPARLEHLLESAAQLPREVQPSADAWPAIRQRIDERRVRAMPSTYRDAHRPARSRRWIGAAAAVVLMAGAAALAVAYRNPATEPGNTASQAASTAPGGPSGESLPGTAVAAPESLDTDGTPRRSGNAAASLAIANPSLASALARYQEATAELEGEVARRTSALSPETRDVVRRSLATIDTAIAELRSALGSNPRDASVGQSLTLVYERKLDFLKRVRALPAAGM